MGEDDYGFFCDLENATTMDYEKVEYYVVTTRTHYEVRRKYVGNQVTKAPPNPIEISNTIPGDDIVTNENLIECKRNNKSFIHILTKLPRDIYYSFMVCCTTISCVYLIMTCS